MKQILIAGGGSGGICLAARLARSGFGGRIGLIEPSEFHYYQPLWTLVGAGLADASSTKKEMSSLIPKGVEWIKAGIKSFEPASNSVQLTTGESISYEVLIVATGLEVNFSAIKGLENKLGRNGLVTIYAYDQASRVFDEIKALKKGRAVFTMPPVPIKCAGAPQKIMYLADSTWRKQKVRKDIQVDFFSAGASIFGVETFAKSLNKVVQRKQINTNFQQKLVEVRAEEKIAVFESTKAGVDGAAPRQEVSYDLLHVVPPMRAHSFVRDSALASQETGQAGWLDVDKFNLQHKRFSNVFGIGDVTGIPNSKTGAAIRKQAPVVCENVKSFLAGKTPSAVYDGYSSCPLTTDIGRVLLAEFGYDGKLLPSFPLDPTRERRLYWHLKKDFLPKMYWHGMLKGLL